MTRSLLTTLKAISPVYVRLFMRELLKRATSLNGNEGGGSQLETNLKKLQEKIDLLAKPEMNFSLQVADSPENEKITQENGVLIGINLTGNQGLRVDEKRMIEGRSRPDALIEDASNEVSILLEMKLGDNLYIDQLERHYKNFFDINKVSFVDVCCQVSWEDIGQIFEELNKQGDNQRDLFLINQFNEYLDLIGLSGFVGFKALDFKEAESSKLQRFLKYIDNNLGEKLDLEEYQGNYQIHFKNEGAYPENICVDYGGDFLKLGIVCGSINKTIRKYRAYRYYCTLSNQSKAQKFYKIIEGLCQKVSQEVPGAKVYVEIKSRFYYSMYRNVYLGEIGGKTFELPSQWQEFLGVYLDNKKNFFDRINKDEIKERFGEEIDRYKEILYFHHKDGSYPHYDVFEGYLQYCYFHLDVLIPSEILVGQKPEDSLYKSELVIAELKEVILGLNKFLD